MQRLDFVAGNLDEHLIKILAREAVFDIFGSPAREDLPLVKEKDAVADFLDVAHVVLRVQNLQNLALSNN